MAVNLTATVTGVEAANGGELLKHWWQWVLVALGLASIVIGASYMVLDLSMKLRRLWVARQHSTETLPLLISTHLQKYAGSQSDLSLEKFEGVRPTSLGIYLGGFGQTPTVDQIRFMESKDMIILDPLAFNVVSAVRNLSNTLLRRHHFVGRLDLAALSVPPSGKRGKGLSTTIQVLDMVFHIISTRLKSFDGTNNGFTGILLAGWDTFSLAIIHELSATITSLRLDVYLETSGPYFLKDPAALNSSSVAGLIVRNGLLRPNGERLDCFDMENLRNTVKAFVSQACLRSFAVLSWETLDAGVSPSLAVLKRTYAWCSFYNVVPWIGSSEAIYDLSVDVVEFRPLSAFDWLKEPRVMQLHEAWRTSQDVHPLMSQKTYTQLSAFLPQLEDAATISSCDHSEFTSDAKTVLPLTADETPEWFILNQGVKSNPLCVSPAGKTYNGLGCFPLGCDITYDDFEEIVWSQRNLRKLDLLDTVPSNMLKEFGKTFNQFASSDDIWIDPTKPGLLDSQDTVFELAKLLIDSSDEVSRGIRVYLGLHSGFQRSPEKQFWAVHHLNTSSVTDLYVSKDVEDLMGTILHTFFVSQDFTRHQCFVLELAFARWRGETVRPHGVSRRIAQDLARLTPDESILLMQRMSLTSYPDNDGLLGHIMSAVKEKLIIEPTTSQLKALNAANYLDGSISVYDLVQSRLRWHCKSKRAHLQLNSAVALFREIENKILAALNYHDSDSLQQVTHLLDSLLTGSEIDPLSDIVALAVFCTMRKLAFEEVYIEVTDRNPLFNDQTDQAAAFAELFALGSRCESYFDVSPSCFGELLTAKFRQYYEKPENQPPLIEESSSALRSAYTEADIDVDPKHKDSEVPAYKRFTFLSVFAIPALIDILMLTTTGHGMYLSSKMSLQEEHSATVALMVSLLVSGAIGTWITCGGTYYLASMAFSAMNYFVITRLLGGFAFTLLVAIVGLIAFTCLSNFAAGVVFFLYFIVLTIYLCLLAALANFQFTGSAFQSGRAVIITCIPILFISPIATIFVQFHDVDIYLTVLYFFVTMLFLGLRQVGAKWTTWYQKIDLLKDAELREWYLSHSNIPTEDLDTLTDPAVLKLAHRTLHHEVLLETKKKFFSKKSTDPIVLKLAKSYDATEFLMSWYSRYSGVPKPMNYSSAWNGQTKVALDSLQKSQLGIRFHNGFIHWRQAGDEIGCAMLYFVIALLDKWIMLLTGQQILGLGSVDKDLTLPIGFGLAYYLVGAVLLDFNASKLFQAAEAQGREEPIPTDGEIYAAERIKLGKRKSLYWNTLGRYLMLHVWGLAVTSILIWLFASSNPRHGELIKNPSRPTIIFLGYVGAYTGLLWSQYTKIFCGPHALKPLLVGLCVGIPTGFILHHKAPKFIYSDVVALGAACWTVAILTLFASKLVGHPKESFLQTLHAKYRAYSGIGPDQEWSQAELQGLHDTLVLLPSEQRLRADPNSEFGKQVKFILAQCRYTKLSKLASRAFPDAEKLIEVARQLFQEGTLRIELVNPKHFSKYDKAMRAVSSSENGTVKLMVACETQGVLANQDPLAAIYQDVGELLIRVTAEVFLGFTPRDAVLAQNLWVTDNIMVGNSPGSSTSDRRLRTIAKAGQIASFIGHMRKQLLQDICLGFDCDIQWEGLSEGIRRHLIDRSLGFQGALTEEQQTYLKDRLDISARLDFETYLARCDYAAFTGAVALKKVMSWADSNEAHEAFQTTLRRVKSIKNLLSSSNVPTKPSLYDKVLYYSGNLYHGAGTIAKFAFIAFVADPEYQRELKWTFSHGPEFLQTFPRIIFNGVWLLSKSVQQMLLPFFMFNDREKVETLWKNIQGTEVTFRRSRITIRNLDGIYTGFIHTVDKETFKLQQYKGDHKTEPLNDAGLCFVNMYSNDMTLQRRIELVNGSTINDYVYEYQNINPRRSRRISRNDLLSAPITRRGIAGQNHLQDVNYNMKGQIDSGSYLKDGNLMRFQYHYQKGAKFEGALIRAEFVLPHMSCTVSWCAAPRRRAENLENWIPHSQVIEATFVVAADVWESKYFYDHKFHPTIVTTLNGQRVDTPPLILYDHLDVLKKPTKISIIDDNPLFSFSSISFNPISRWLGLQTRRYPVSTSQARSWLWKAWKEQPGFDGVIVRWLDERLLRRDPVLRPYWRYRDSGELEAAEAFLDKNRDAVMAIVDLDNTVSSWTPLAIKLNDLYSFGQGGDACTRTRSNIITQEEDDDTALHVLAVDTGTWPNEGGGVSACRSDVINNLRTIKWHMVSESANDFGLPKRQIERNVHSLKIIPLWGLDLMTPIHGLFANRLDSQVEHITTHATLIDIERSFVPILSALISGARTIDFDRCDVKQFTRALINLNAYFKEGAHWSHVWRSDIVKNAWRRLWLSQTTANARPSSKWLKTELPTLGQLDQGLELWSRYLFIFSIPIPDKLPPVFQCSHHSVSASYGVICKIKRGCTLQIWDHAISWRETSLYMSSALCPLSPFVRNSLLGLMRVTSVLILHHADTILPCADFFNPNWEVEIGTCQGRIEHRAMFKRKIDPVVNGITDMTGFAPVGEIKTKTPTVTMLSHIWFAKDIKTAILSADIIVNEYGFKDYRMEIYGALDKTPAYTTACQEILATKSLRDSVVLAGEANPIQVLEKTWVFLNSSVSEGLPLALGEAALTGAPVVCTDVGASLRVLTNPGDGACYSAVVAPNDARAMARAQIKILALLEEFSQYADQEVGNQDASFPEKPTPEDVARITQRMYDQSDARRRLGMKSREIVQKSFSGERYLREHEQMLWVGKARNDMSRATPSRSSMLMQAPKPAYLAANTTAPEALARLSQMSQLPVEGSLPSLTIGRSSMIPSMQTDLSTLKSEGRVKVAEPDRVRRLRKENRGSLGFAKTGLRVQMRPISYTSLGTSEVI